MDELAPRRRVDLLPNELSGIPPFDVVVMIAAATLVRPRHIITLAARGITGTMKSGIGKGTMGSGQSVEAALTPIIPLHERATIRKSKTENPLD